MARSRRVLGLGRRSWQAVAAVGVSVALVAVGSTAAMADTLPGGPSTTGQTGLRPNATRVSFRLSDRIDASVDVATGNLNISGTLLSLPGVNGAVPITLAYNSLATTSGDNFMDGADATGWTYGLAGAGSLSLQSNGSTVDFTSTDGAVWPFTPVSGSSTAYTAPPGLKAVLVKTTNGWSLYYLQSSETVAFDGTGRPLSVTDRNGNASTVDWSTGALTSTAGSSDASTAYGYYDSTYATEHLYQEQNGSQGRQWLVAQNSAGEIDSWGTPDGNWTYASYNSAGQMVKFWNEGDYELDFTYDSFGRIAEVDQVDHSQRTTKAATASTRFSYVSSTQTQVAGPDTSLSQSVSAVPHATYTINSSTELVTQATDQMGRVQSATYTGNLDLHTATVGSSTTTNTYGANNGMSLTSTASQGGATSTATYTNASQSQQYLPSTTTDAAGNQTNYSYNTAGDMTGSTLGTGSQPAAQPVVAYNSDGTIATATLPGNNGNPTTYGYNSLHELTSVTPPTGTGLGVKRYTYDSYGRLATATDGAGHTTSYTYDQEDRLLTTSFSDSTPTVTNTYDATGNLTQQTSGGGTITNTYDVFNRLLSTSNTAGGGTIAYGYDPAGNQTSLTTAIGTTTNAFDASGVLVSSTHPEDSGTAMNVFQTNSNGQRTDEWLESNTAHTTWSAHIVTSYDSSGRVSEVAAATGPASNPTTVMDTTYSYAAASTGTTCSSTAASGDRVKLQSTHDAVSGQTTTYCYDTFGRLLNVTQSGGSGTNNTYTYAYDANGDRTSATVSGSTSSSQSLSYNAADQITNSGYTYDGAGNLTASPSGTYSYNPAEQMTSATNGGHTYQYSYAGASQTALLKTSGNGQTKTYTYGGSDPQGNPELVAYNNSAASAIAYITPDPVTGQATQLQDGNQTSGLYLYDGIGNPVAVLSNWNGVGLGVTYDPYGLATLYSGSVPEAIAQNPYAFKSGISDSGSGFVKFGQRWYNAITGSWTQQDTLDAPLDPANANRYAYSGDDPINLGDPSGLVTRACVEDVVELLLASGVALGTALSTPFTVGASGLVTVASAGYAIKQVYDLSQDCKNNSVVYVGRSSNP